MQLLKDLHWVVVAPCDQKHGGKLDVEPRLLAAPGRLPTVELVCPPALPVATMTRHLVADSCSLVVGVEAGSTEGQVAGSGGWGY